MNDVNDGITQQDYKPGSVCINDGAYQLAEVLCHEVYVFNDNIKYFLSQMPEMMQYVSHLFNLMRIVKASTNLPYVGIKGLGEGLTMAPAHLFFDQLHRSHDGSAWLSFRLIRKAGFAVVGEVVPDPKLLPGRATEGAPHLIQISHNGRQYLPFAVNYIEKQQKIVYPTLAMAFPNDIMTIQHFYPNYGEPCFDFSIPYGLVITTTDIIRNGFGITVKDEEKPLKIRRPMEMKGLAELAEMIPCVYCGSLLNKMIIKCPYCGAPRTSLDSESATTAIVHLQWDAENYACLGEKGIVSDYIEEVTCQECLQNLTEWKKKNRIEV